MKTELLIFILIVDLSLAWLPSHGSSDQYHIQTDEGPTRFFKYQTDSGQYRKERRLADGTVIGSEGWVDNNGYFRLKDYIADKNGYRILKSKTVYVGKANSMSEVLKIAKGVPTQKEWTQVPLYNKPRVTSNYIPPVESPKSSYYIPPSESPKTSYYVPPSESPKTSYYVPPSESPKTSYYIPPSESPKTSYYVPPKSSYYVPPAQSPKSSYYIPPTPAQSFNVGTPGLSAASPSYRIGRPEVPSYNVGTPQLPVAVPSYHFEAPELCETQERSIISSDSPSLQLLPPLAI